ncbi:MAG: hypothetical protein V3R89_00250 [Thermoanaerobaculia bacterium]
MRLKSLLGLGGAVFAASAWAQTPSISVGELTCLPVEENTTLDATVTPEVEASRVRLYFRRLNPVGAFYYAQMLPSGDSHYRSVFPKAEDREQQRLTDEWWKILKERDWMEGKDRDWMEDWLERQENEAAEYFVAVHDATGTRLSRSETRLVEVRTRDDCPTDLTAQEFDRAENLTVGETTEIQAGRQVFHWLCDGIVSRIDSVGVLRADEFCRASGIGLVPGVSPSAPPAAASRSSSTRRRSAR